MAARSILPRELSATCFPCSTALYGPPCSDPLKCSIVAPSFAAHVGGASFHIARCDRVSYAVSSPFYRTLNGTGAPSTLLVRPASTANTAPRAQMLHLKGD